jgi:hypothetical protein
MVRPGFEARATVSRRAALLAAAGFFLSPRRKAESAMDGCSGKRDVPTDEIQTMSPRVRGYAAQDRAGHLWFPSAALMPDVAWGKIMGAHGYDDRTEAEADGWRVVSVEMVEVTD